MSEGEYTPAERQLISHEEALALEFERLVDELYQRREDRAEARRQFMAGVEALNQPYKPQPMIMSKRDFEDILKYEEGVRMKEDALLVKQVWPAGTTSSLTTLEFASARKRRRVEMGKKPAAPAVYAKRNRKSKK